MAAFLRVIVLLTTAALLLASESPGLAAETTCAKCGMEVSAYAYSHAEIIKENGEPEKFCSVTCALQIARLNPMSRIRVADYDTHELIDAEKAFWVVGGSKPGVMSREAKWAFGIKARAEVFIGAWGGALVDWKEVVRLTDTEAKKAEEEAKSFFSR